MNSEDLDFEEQELVVQELEKQNFALATDEELSAVLLNNKILAYGSVKGSYVGLAPMARWLLKLKRLHRKYFYGYTEIVVPALIEASDLEGLELAINNNAILDFVYKTTDNQYLSPTAESLLYSTSWLKNEIKSRALLPTRLISYGRAWRRERKTTPLIRSCEISAFWEVHCLFEKYPEADQETRTTAKQYINLFKSMDLTVHVINRFPGDKFTGAQQTKALDFIIGDRRLQIATSHNLGQNFSKVFDLRIKTAENKLEYAWQTCHGMTERVLGGILHSSLRKYGAMRLPKTLRLKQLLTAATPTEKDYAHYDIVVGSITNSRVWQTLVRQALARDSIVVIHKNVADDKALIIDRARRRRLFMEQTYFYDTPEENVPLGEQIAKKFPVPSGMQNNLPFWQKHFEALLGEDEVLYGYDEKYVYGGKTY